MLKDVHEFFQPDYDFLLEFVGLFAFKQNTTVYLYTYTEVVIFNWKEQQIVSKLSNHSAINSYKQSCQNYPPIKIYQCASILTINS